VFLINSNLNLLLVFGIHGFVGLKGGVVIIMVLCLGVHLIVLVFRFVKVAHGRNCFYAALDDAV